MDNHVPLDELEINECIEINDPGRHGHDHGQADVGNVQSQLRPEQTQLSSTLAQNSHREM